jgi:hypothetical protein
VTVRAPFPWFGGKRRVADVVWRAFGPDVNNLRIALCGYAGEHEMPGWTEHAWKAARGYASEENDNRERERIWFSPHCLPLDEQPSLFSAAGGFA